MGELLETRREETTKRIERIRRELKQAETLCSKRACVFATGSFGRGEASQHSDLDLFIAGERPGLSRLNQILVKADLIKVTCKLKLPPFSGDGAYLAHYTIDDLVKTLGKREDDVTNTFTARLLLILESRPLLEANLASSDHSRSHRCVLA